MNGKFNGVKNTGNLVLCGFRRFFVVLVSDVMTDNFGR